MNLNSNCDEINRTRQCTHFFDLSIFCMQYNEAETPPLLCSNVLVFISGKSVLVRYG
jgi:hypothetical protein